MSFFTTMVIAQDTYGADTAKDATVATTPIPRQEEWWKTRHQRVNAFVKQNKVDLIFIGDSITHGWDGPGQEIWDKYYAKRNAVNLGFSGDQTSHVLWRLENGNIDGISPKLAVIMIGTNNAGHGEGQSPEQIFDGVKAIVDKVRTKLPAVKILLLAIFPRGEDANDRVRKVNTAANAMIAKLANNNTVFHLDIGPHFVSSDGKLNKDIMPDLLHPNLKGYEIWAKAMEPSIVKLMGE